MIFSIVIPKLIPSLIVCKMYYVMFLTLCEKRLENSWLNASYMTLETHDAIAPLASLLARKKAKLFFSSRRPKKKYLDFVLNRMFTLQMALND